MGCGKQREATAPIESLVKLQSWFLSLRWKTCLCAEVLPWCLSLQRKICLWAEHSDDDDDDDDDVKIMNWVLEKKRGPCPNFYLW